eukprot:COSAG02_NODE_77781_length_122_cov_157.260870_1_plen_29_part_01
MAATVELLVVSARPVQRLHLRQRLMLGLL